MLKEAEMIHCVICVLLKNTYRIFFELFGSFLAGDISQQKLFCFYSIFSERKRQNDFFIYLYFLLESSLYLDKSGNKNALKSYDFFLYYYTLWII